MTIALLIVLLLFVGAILAFLLVQARRPLPPDTSALLMQQQINSLREQVQKSLSDNSQSLHQQLSNVTQSLQNSSGDVNRRLDNAAKLYADLKNKLGELSQQNVQMSQAMGDIKGLQDILKPPKMRGGMGETLLEMLLKEILPPETFELQYGFRSGEKVDAIIRLQDRLVSVDSKFPLENFQRMLNAASDDERKAARREFVRNVKKHIDAIRDKYILPDEGTMEFALMYIPAENVYYETIIKGEETNGEKEIYQYAIDSRVIPVSPNSFYAYLMTLALGFRGLQIETRAREIMDSLGRLQGDLGRFKQEFEIVGTHLTNAQKKYEDADKRLNRFEERLGTVSSASEHRLETVPDPLLPSGR